MSPGCGTIVRSRDLQNVLTRLFWCHTELVFSRPPLHLGNRRRRREAMLHDIPVEANRHFDVAATMQMHFNAGVARMLRDAHKFSDHILFVLEEQKGFVGEPVLFADAGPLPGFWR